MKTYINNVLPKKVSDLVDDSGHYTKPSGGIPASDLADGVVPVEDVQVNGTSIVADGVANVPIATSTQPGTVKIEWHGLMMQSDGTLSIVRALIPDIKLGAGTYVPITPSLQHASTFYGLAKAAGDTTQSVSDNEVGNYTDSAKTAIKNMLGVPEDPLAAGTALPASADLNSYTTPGNYTADSTVIASITHAPTTTVEYKLTVEQISDEVIKQTVTTTEAPANVYQRTGDSSSTDWVFGDWVKEIKSTDYASSTTGGVIKVETYSGHDVHNGVLRIFRAQEGDIKTGIHAYKPITPSLQQNSVFYGLTKAAGVDMKDSSNAVGTYTDEAKTAINKMIGSYGLNSGEAIPTNADLNTYTTPGTYSADSTVIASITNAPTTTETYKLVVETVNETVIEQIVTAANGKVYRRTGDSSSSTWVFTNWAKDITNTDYATDTEAGVVKIYGPNGISIDSNKQLAINYPSSTQIKNGAAYFRPIVPALQHESVFYGLAKASGDTTQSASDNAVGTYTDDAKTAIRTMLGTVGDVQVNGTSVTNNGVANIPMADGTNPGVVKLDLSGGIRLNASGGIDVNRTTSEYYIKQGTHGYLFVPVISQHISTFYGLAKAAGDTTQSTSSNPVGTYTQEAKTAIQAMLGVTVPEAVGSCVEYTSDSSVTIVGEPNTRYVCGEVTSISITPPAVGTIDVTFTSGSTIAILTLPSTVKMPEWWGGVEAGYTYELVITDGVYAGVMAWPQ